MDAKIKKTIREIKALEIQGARNVASSALDVLAYYVKTSKAKTPKELQRGFEKLRDELENTRPTEPMMRNLLRESSHFMYSLVKTTPRITKIKKEFRNFRAGRAEKMEEDIKRLAEYGAALIPDNALIVTHCHSSTVTRILRAAKKRKKKFSVVACETRPRYQGRETAEELAKAGIDVTLVVDGAMTQYMKKADIVLVGADSVTSRGDLINKIGTSTVAHIAKSHDVSFYSAAELSKYSSLTIYGHLEEIEERAKSEVWPKPPKGVKISNPAFEATAAKYMNGYITEVGVIPPQSFFTLATQKMGIKIYGGKIA